MELQLSTHQLHLIIRESAELGAILALTKTGKLKPYLKKSEAFRKYGRANVERWAREQLLTVRKDGNDSAAWRLDRLELEANTRAARLVRYL